MANGKRRVREIGYLDSHERIMARPQSDVSNPVPISQEAIMDILSEVISYGEMWIIVRYNSPIPFWEERIVQTTEGDGAFYAKTKCGNIVHRYVLYKKGSISGDLSFVLSRHIDAKKCPYYFLEGVHVGEPYILEPWNKQKSFKRRYPDEDPSIMLEKSKEFWQTHAYCIKEEDVETLDLDTRTTKPPPGW